MKIYFYKPTDLTDTELEILEFENLTRRRFITAAGGLVGAAALGACGAAEEQTSAPTATSSGSERTIAGVLGNTYTLSEPPARLHASGGTDMDNALALGVVPQHVQTFLDSELAQRIPAAAGGTFILPTDGNIVYYLSALSIPIFVDQLAELLG
jgi:hypothetical protein